MRDPWHAETAEALVRYVRATIEGGGTAWTIVESSGEAVEREVVAHLRRALADLRVRTVRVDDAELPEGLEVLRELAPVEGAVNLVRGLSELLRGERAEEAATWLNLRREALARPGEAMVLLLSTDTVEPWLRYAPDLNGHTQHFAFVEWADLLEQARAAVDFSVVESDRTEDRREHAERRAERLRELGDREALTNVLVQLAELSWRSDRRTEADASDRYRAMEGWLYLSEVERRLARLDRLEGALDRAEARVREGLGWHEPEGARPAEARDRVELALVALGRGDAETARSEARHALDLVVECGTRLDEPAALVALGTAERGLGRTRQAEAHEARWRRLVRGMEAGGLEADLERDAAWAVDRG